MDRFFNPRSIVIVGVSHEKNKVGYLVAKNLIDQGYKGKTFFVNNKYKGKILGKPVYSSLDEVISKEKSIDLVVLAIPSIVSFQYLDELYKHKIKNAVIFAAGFKETDEKGRELEERLKEKAEKFSINILGPNCIGYINTHLGVNTTFLKSISPIGNIGFISQSGALGSALVDYFLSHENIGFSYFISLGNKTMIDESTSLEFLINDKKTSAVFLYIEDVKDGDRFKQVLKKAALKKPVVILKSGKTTEGAKAAFSHTGGMASDDRIFDSLMSETGAIRADSYIEFLTLMKIFSYGRLPNNNSILVLSNAGGAGVLLTDEIIKNDLKLVTLSKDLTLQLSKSFENIKKISVHNPIDLLGDASAYDYEKAFQAMKIEKNIGAVIVLLTPQANTQIYETAKALVDMQKQYDTPIYPVFMGKKSTIGVGKLFEKNKIIGFANFEYLIPALKKITDYLEYLKSGELSDVMAKISSLSNNNLNNRVKKLDISKPDLFSSLELLNSIGINTAKTVVIESIKDINKIRSLEYPLVAKVSSDKINHKTEVGGVIVNIRNSKELVDACKKLFLISKRIVVQEMVKGHELLLSAKKDSSYGVVLALGIGGVYTELLKQIDFKIYPLSQFEFEKMLEVTKVNNLLNNFRNQGMIDSQKIYYILCKLGEFITKNPNVKEIEINPLIISSKSIKAVDCRILLDNT